MTEPNSTTVRILGRELPVQIGPYIVERLIRSNPSYADYHARHHTLGHGLLFRHERWPSAADPRDSRSIDTTTGDGAELDALEGLRRARRLQAELLHPRILPVI